MFQQRVGDAEVAFAFSKSIGIHLVRHRRRATSPATRAWRRYRAKYNPTHPTQVYEHDIDRGHGVAVLGNPVVRLDLRRVGIQLQVQRFYESR